MNPKLFLWLITAILLVSIHRAEAQQPQKTPRIGYLTILAGPSDRDAAFRRGLNDEGFRERQNVAIRAERKV